MSSAKKPLLKKRKVDSQFKPPASSQPVDLTSDASQQQNDSQGLATNPVKPNGSKLDKAILESISEEDSSASLDDQEEFYQHEAMMHDFREQTRCWLGDHGKALFHVEYLAWIRAQEKKESSALSEVPPTPRRKNAPRWK